MIKPQKILPKADKILFGGDYNPEQWPEDVWEEDMRLFRLAHADTVTLNVFSWTLLQPAEGVYDFSKLDRIMEYVQRNRLKVILATATAAEPAWMAAKYPEMLRVQWNGVRMHFGGRQNMCPNSEVFRRNAACLAGKLAERYGGEHNLVGWHISNEYGSYCYCETCTRKFRGWLQKRYGTIEEVNRVWNTAFWNHTFTSFEEIVLPDLRSEEFHYGNNDLGPVRSNFQGMSLDYRRFMNDSILECYKLERDAIREHMPEGAEVPITTNLMGNFHDLDYRRWAKEMDFVSWDNYPAPDQPDSDAACWHDLMRGIGGGKAFSLMEQTPGVSNWHPYCRLKRPGVMRLWSYQAVAHGADTVLYFQMRRTVADCEKMHSALIDHVGDENTRVFREMSQLGGELEKLGGVTLGGVAGAEAAIVFDWENWWAVSLAAGPSIHLDYLDEIHTWYRFFFDHHIPVDLVGPEDELAQYKLMIAPMLYLHTDAFTKHIRSFTRRGGTFVTSYFSGYADENDRIRLGGYPAAWRDILGIWVEESDALSPESGYGRESGGRGDDMSYSGKGPEEMENSGGVSSVSAGYCGSANGKPIDNSFVYRGNNYPCRILCDLIHSEGADPLGNYQRDFYHGMPAVTRNQFGKGTAYYVGTRSDAGFYAAFLSDICRECGIEAIADAPAGVEVTRRENGNGIFYFILNYTDGEQTVILPQSVRNLLTGRNSAALEPIRIQAKDAAILQAAVSPGQE